MSGLLRHAKVGLVALVALALVLGVNGFVGAIHSVHHLPAPAEKHHHAAGYGHEDGERGAPTPAPEEPCPVAAAALQVAGAGVETPSALGPSPALAALVALGPQDKPRAARKEPARGRAPPSLRSLPS